MTITARHAHARLAAAATLLGRVTDRLPATIGHVALTVAAGPDRPLAEDAGIRGKGNISDPTFAAASRRLAVGSALDGKLEDVEQHVDTLVLALTLLVAFCDANGPYTVPNHPKCNGGRGVEPWMRPDCDDFVGYAVRNDGSYSYRTDGLCDACRQRKAHHERRMVERDAAA